MPHCWKSRHISYNQISKTSLYGPLARKPFGVCDKVRLKPSCSATETSYNIEILHIQFSYLTNPTVNNKGADQAVYMHRLVCSFVVCVQQSVFFCLMLYVSVNSYGHAETVSSPNHNFSWASLNKRLTSTLCTYLCL